MTQPTDTPQSTTAPEHLAGLEWVAPARASRLTGLTPDRLRQLADLGKLPCQRDARGHRTYRLDAVRDLARTRRQGRRELGLLW